MGKYTVTEDNREEFTRKYLPDHTVRVCKVGEEPEGNEFPIYVALIKDGGLRFPFDPLLVRFINHTRMPLQELDLNTVRIILGVSRLNHLLGLDLGLDELFYCYCVVDSQHGYYLKSRPKSPSLVVALPTSNKGKLKEIIMVFGTISSIPDVEVPMSFDRPGTSPFVSRY